MATARRRRLRLQNQVTVPRPPPLAQMGFEGARHNIPERLPSAKKERAVTLRAIDWNQDTIDNITKLSGSIRRLDLTSLRLNSVSEDIMTKLSALERLDVSFNELTEDSFPASMKNLENLVELSAHYNKLTKLPTVIRRLKNLTRLKVGHNKVQIIQGLEKLRKLNILVLDHNDLETLNRELFTLKRLEILHIGSNRLKDIHPDIRFLKNLANIDISHNQLIMLPPEVFLLPHIEVLNASNNQITRLPTIHIKGRLQRKLTLVDLSENLLVKFPEHLVLMTEKLDLSENKIKVIPGNIIKKLEWGTDQQLIVTGNPLISPPEDVCGCGLKSIMHYFQETKADMKVYQGLKVLFVGPQGAGKSSFVQSLVDQQPRLTTEEESTVGVDVYDTTFEFEQDGIFEKTMYLSLWDFSGRPTYQYHHYFFFQQPALAVLVFNLQGYSSDKFQEMIGSWLDWMIAKKNQLVMLVVGTHSDCMSHEDTKEVCDDVSKRIRSHIKEHIKCIEREIKKIEGRANIPPSLSEQLKQYISLLKLQTTIHETVLAVSSATMDGIGPLWAAVQSMACDQKVFPNVMRVIPSLWVDVENYVEDRGNYLQFPLMTWDEYTEEVSKKFGMKHLMPQITQYLHDIGKVIWFSDHPTLKDLVILRSSWLTDLMKALFRHDYAALDYGQDDSLKSTGLPSHRFEKYRKEVCEEGIIDKELLKCLWATLVPTELNKPMQLILTTLVENFEIAYVVSRPGKEARLSALSRTSKGQEKERTDSAGTVRAMKMDKIDCPTKQDPDPNAPPRKITRLLIPWMRGTNQPKSFRDEYDSYRNNPRLTPFFRFPRYMPPGFFESCIVRANHNKHKLNFIYHWKHGAFAKHQEQAVGVYLQRYTHEDKSTCIRLEAVLLQDQVHLEDVEADTPRKDVEQDTRGARELWAVLLPFLRDVDSLVAQFSGARVERYMECPSCHALPFLGEWITPKEVQAMTTKICDVCKTPINTAYLVQPKEKRTVDEFLLKKLMQEAERRQMLEREET